MGRAQRPAQGDVRRRLLLGRRASSIAALGVATDQLWLVYLGYGVIGGIGLGIGYISPVSTLIKWFPDRPGLATGLAIMGFGGGALIAAPLSNTLLERVRRQARRRDRAGVRHARRHLLRRHDARRVHRAAARPRAGSRTGWEPDARPSGRMITRANVTAANAIRTPQFWLLWVVLCCNVTAGIGILEQASPMIQDHFDTVSAAAAAGLRRPALALQHERALRVVLDVGPDRAQARCTCVYLGVGAVLYFLLASTGTASVAWFVLLTGVILSFYGGGFSTVPAYLKDLFGTIQVGAIHGRLLTAWSAAGVAGPLIVNAIADAQTAAGKSGADLYTLSLYIMVGVLIGRLHREPADPARQRALPWSRPRRRTRSDRSRARRGAGEEPPMELAHGRLRNARDPLWMMVRGRARLRRDQHDRARWRTCSAAEQDPRAGWFALPRSRSGRCPVRGDAAGMSTRLHAGAVLVCCCAALAALPALASAAPPSNDARIAPQDLGPLPAVARGTTAEATLEEDEPGSSCGPIKNSVWFSFTAPSSRDLLVALDAAGDLDATVEVFTRQRSQLTPLTCQQTDRRGAATIDADAAAGTTYLVRVAPARQLGRRQLHPPGRAPRRARPAARRSPPGRGDQRACGPLREPRRRLVDAHAGRPHVPHQPRNRGQGLRAGRALCVRGLRRQRRGEPRVR